MRKTFFGDVIALRWTVILEHEDGNETDGGVDILHLQAPDPEDAGNLARKRLGYDIDNSRIIAIFAGWHDEQLNTWPADAHRRCGHSVCSQNYIDTGDARCIAGEEI